MQDLRAEQLVILVSALRDHLLHVDGGTSVTFHASSW